MKTTVLLIRHGQTDWNVSRRAQGHLDVPLNATGLQQSELLARRLAARPIQAVYSSDLARARETAVIIAQVLGLEPVLETAFRERNGGIFQGHTADELRRLYPQALRAFGDHGRPPPGAESNLDVARRAVPRLKAISNEHRGQEIALISHGGTMRVMIAHLLGLPVGRRAPFRVSANAGLSVAEVGDEEHAITLLNDTCHLKRLVAAADNDRPSLEGEVDAGYTLG